MANETKETKKAQAIREKQARRDSANGVRSLVKVSFIAFLGTMLNAIITQTKEACSGRMVADVAERIGRDSGKVETTRKNTKGKMQTYYVADPLMAALYGTMGLLAACGFATGDVAALLLEQGLISEKAVVSGDGLEALAIRAKAMAKARSFIKILHAQKVITDAQYQMATDYKGIRTLLLGKGHPDTFTRALLGKATGVRATTVMVDALRAKLSELREKTRTDKESGTLTKKDKPYTMALADFLVIVTPPIKETAAPAGDSTTTGAPAGDGLPEVPAGMLTADSTTTGAPANV